MMDISKYTIADFVFDESFRKWVLEDDQLLENQWQMLIQENPKKQGDIQQAKKVLLNYQNQIEVLEAKDIWEMWKQIDQKTNRLEFEKAPKPIASMNSRLPNRIISKGAYFTSQWKSVAAILLIVFSLGGLISYSQEEKMTENEYISVVIENVKTEKGEKSSFVLQDGTEVMVNAGSSLKFKKGFDSDQREIFLNGEAYFKVAKDSLKPFRVVSAENISVTAIGTSFMIQAYPDEEMKVSLLTGKVKIELNEEKDPVYLEKGEGLKINTATKHYFKHKFNSDQVLAWTKKTIFFDKVPISEAIRALENWYGVHFSFKNTPPTNLLLTGKFEDETLKNVLEGLKYTSDIQYELEGKKITISFKN